MGVVREFDISQNGYASEVCHTAFNAVIGYRVDDEDNTEPVTLSEAKAFAYIDLDDNDAVVQSLITVARQQCETFACISILKKTITAELRNECGNISLPYCPLIEGSGQSVVFYDADGKDISSGICLKGLQFPFIETKSLYIKAVYSAGYNTVPEKVKTAIKMQVAYLYEHRGDEQALAELSPMAKTILKPMQRT